VFTVAKPLRLRLARDRSALAAERDDDLVAARLESHAREAVGQHATTEVRRELALDVARQAAALGVGVAQLGEHRLRVARDQLVQHGALRRAPSISSDRMSGRAARPFVRAAREHARAQWKFRAAIPARSIATFRSTASDVRTTATTSASVAYDIDGAAQKIFAADLERNFGNRLFLGRVAEERRRERDGRSGSDQTLYP
jgi:hypothetical protein